MPAFSQAVCKFTNNISELKKLAVRDYEDLLQVTIFPLMLHNILIPLISVPSWHLKDSLRDLITNVS